MVATLAAARWINWRTLDNSNANLVANLQLTVKPTNMLIGWCDKPDNVKCQLFLQSARLP